MKVIIDNRLYDTEVAEMIFSYQRKVDKGVVFWNDKLRYTPFHKFNIYKTQKGAFFEHDTEDNKINVMSKQEVERIMKNLDPDKYIEFFEVVVEEA